jgi:tetratricopeptide (TPR) repeat protein
MVKNEGKNIKKCLSSSLKLKSMLSEILVLDTGSTDNTVDIVKNFTDKIFYKEFTNNYAEMRNYLLDKVETDWVLFLDGDELLLDIDADILVKLISNVSKDVSAIRFYRYNFFNTGGWYTDQVIKLFRNDDAFRYNKLVTEKIDERLFTNKGTIIEPDILLNHYGHCKSSNFRYKKFQTYVELLRKQLLITPDDSILHSCIGINCMNIGKLDEALIETKKGVEENPVTTIAYEFYGFVLRALNMNVEALEAYKKGYSYAHSISKKSRMQNLIGLMYLTLGDYKNAELCFTEAIQNTPILLHIWINLGLVYFFTKQFSKAIECFNKVVKRNEAFL